MPIGQASRYTQRLLFPRISRGFFSQKVYLINLGTVEECHTKSYYLLTMTCRGASREMPWLVTLSTSASQVLSPRILICSRKLSISVSGRSILNVCSSDWSWDKWYKREGRLFRASVVQSISYLLALCMTFVSSSRLRTSTGFPLLKCCKMNRSCKCGQQHQLAAPEVLKECIVYLAHAYDIHWY